MTLFVVEVFVFIFFVCFVDYADASGTVDGRRRLTAADTDQVKVSTYYAMYQDVNVMIFIGFGFLMTFLRKHGFNSLGLTLLLGCLSIQLHIVFETLLHDWANGDKIHVDLTIVDLIRGDFAAGAVLISMGAVLGRVTFTQMIWMALFELIFFAVNEWIGVNEYEAVDMGGSMFVHTFGAYFGLACSWALGPPNHEETKDEASVYHSDMFAMIGTIFLWMYWPSFNGALAGEEYHSQERVVINTVLSLTCSCISAFFFSHYYCGKLDMVHIQNASLAGGVAVGSSSDLVIGPWPAIIIGLVSGWISVTGYHYFTPVLNKIGIYDVCGVHNLHGMPGIMGGIAGAISSAMANELEYGSNIGSIFGARACEQYDAVDTGLCIVAGRSASDQGWYQAATLATTLGMAIVGGAFTGTLISKTSCCRAPKRHLFSDYDEWEVPEQEYAFSYFGHKSKITELHVMNPRDIDLETVGKSV